MINKKKIETAKLLVETLSFLSAPVPKELFDPFVTTVISYHEALLIEGNIKAAISFKKSYNLFEFSLFKSKKDSMNKHVGRFLAAQLEIGEYEKVSNVQDE